MNALGVAFLLFVGIDPLVDLDFEVLHLFLIQTVRLKTHLQPTYDVTLNKVEVHGGLVLDSSNSLIYG